MWEIYSFGAKPYPDMTVPSIVKVGLVKDDDDMAADFDRLS